MADVPWDDYYGAGSPLERFVAAGGRVLRLGADDDTVTLIHYAEYLAPIADKRRVRRHRLVPAARSAGGARRRHTRRLRRHRRLRRLDDDEFAVILRCVPGEGGVVARQGRRRGWPS